MPDSLRLLARRVAPQVVGVHRPCLLAPVAALAREPAELENESEDFELRGLIAELDSDGETFRIGGQLVDYSNAEIENAPPDGLANDLYVEVEAEDDPVGGVLFATEVEVNARLEAEGVVGDDGVLVAREVEFR